MSGLLPPPPAATADDTRRQQVFDEVALWLYDNFAFFGKGLKHGAGFVVPIRTRTIEMTTLAAFRGELMPYRIEIVGPKGGITRLSPVDTWMSLPGRVTVAGFRTAPDRPWPTFEEDGKLYVNRYLRPELPEDGDASIGHKFLKVLLPDEREKNWLKQCLCHKLKHPEVPGPAIVMVARGKYGVGRDTFYALLEAMFGEQYISKPSFDMVTNQGSQGQFNDWMADSIWALVDETLSTDSNRYQRRHEAFEALKRNFEPARKRRDIKRKYLPPETMLCGPSGIFATNDPQPLAIADADRRFTFLTNGEVQQPKFYADLHAWMRVPGNVGAFRRDLENVSLEGFNAYGSLPTRLKDMIIADSKSELDEAVATAAERVLPGAAFSIRQVCEAVQAMTPRDPVTGERALPNNWQLIVRSIVGREYHAVGIPPRGRNWQPEFEGRRTRTFARTDAAAKRCTRATAHWLRTQLKNNQNALDALRKANGKLPLLRVVVPGAEEA
jgi:hypothetical protein